MTWVKLDDTCPDHPSIVGLSDAAFACWVRSLCYSSRHLTDGFIPVTARKMLGTSKAVAELEEAGRWEPVENGWMVHGYQERQRTREQVVSQRDKWRDRQQRHRNVTPMSRRDSPECHADVTPPETEVETETEEEGLSSVKQNITSRVPGASLQRNGELDEPVPFYDALRQNGLFHDRG